MNERQYERGMAGIVCWMSLMLLAIVSGLSPFDATTIFVVSIMTAKVAY